MNRKPVVTVYARHSGKCPHEGKEFYRGCDCPKWLRYSLSGKQHRIAASTRTWTVAEEKREELQKRLDAGDSPAVASSSEQATISAAIETYLIAKTSEGIQPATLRKLRFQLSALEKFMAARSKFFPEQLTAQDVIEYRATWDGWKSGLTRQKAQTNLRGFLKAVGRADLLSVLKSIKLSREDYARLKPRPFTEAELKRLLAQVPVTFPEPKKAARMTALIHLMVSTGLAIRDALQLERANLEGGWLRIQRQKMQQTEKGKVTQKLDESLARELETVTNGNSRYVFWNGNSDAFVASNNLLADIGQLMRDAGLYVKGNVSHRFRDTAVDFWLGKGESLSTVAMLLGNTVAMVEKHYADLASKRMEERLAKVPTRSW
jgi:site-specific recombinase XerD